MDKRLEVEIDTPNNQGVYFLPLRQTLRGRLDWSRVPQRDVGRLHAWVQAGPIPGLHLGLDLETGTGYIVDPLVAESEHHRAVLDRIDREGMKIPSEAREKIQCHPATWAYWLERLVDDGQARLIRGEWPRDLEGDPQREFGVYRPRDPADRLADAVEKQNGLIMELLGAR